MGFLRGGFLFIMAITLVSQGTTPTGTATGTGTTSVTPATPGTMNDGNIVLIFVFNKPNTSTPATPTDWTLVGTGTGGTGIQGIDTGQTRITVFSRVKTTAWSTMPAISIASNSSATAQAFVYSNATSQWDVAFTTGSDSTAANTAVSVTGAANPGITAGDMVVVGFTGPSDGITYSAQGITATGVTFGTTTERSEPATTQGNDLGGYVSETLVSSGTASAAPVATATASTTNSYGVGGIVRLREVLTSVAGSETNSVAITETASVSVIQSTMETVAVNISEAASVSISQSASDSSSVVVSETSSVKASFLDSFFTAINNRESKRVNIGLIGASVTEGFPATREKQIEFQLANMLRNYYPTSGNPGGIGYFGLPSTPVFNNGTGYVTFAGTGATYNTSFGWGGKHATWYTFSNQSGTITFHVGPEGPWTSFDINVLTGPTGTANGFRYSVDGGAIQTASNYSAAYQITKIRINSAVNSTVAIQANTTSTLQIVINGLTAYKGDENKGIQVHNFGHSGYKISDWMTTDGNSGLPHWREDIIAEDLDLLILGEFGANDGSVSGGNLSAASFKTSYGNFIDYIRATGFSKPILCVAAMDVSAGITYAEPWANYVQAIKEVAEAKGCAFVDLRNHIPASPNAIYGADNVHTNTSGSLSRMYAEALAEQLTDNKFDGATISITESINLTKTISSSDSGAVSISDASTTAITSTSNDSSSVSISETRTQAVTINASDTSSVAVSETSLTNKEITSSDTSSIAITEVTQLEQSQAVSASDTGSVQISETTSSSLSSTHTDTSSVAVSDVAQLTNIVSASETGSIAISETSATVKSMSAQDSGSLSLSESSSLTITRDVASSDSSSLAVSETSTLYVDRSAADSFTVSVSETTSGFVAATADDGGSLTIADPALDLGIVTAGDDSSTISINETTSLSIFNDLNVSESFSVVLNETTSQNVTLSSADSGSFVVDDDGGFSKDIVAADSFAVAVSETESVSVSVSSEDSSYVLLTENNSGNNTAITSDIAAISASETYSIWQYASTTDNSSVSISETSSITGLNAASSSDSAFVSVFETAVVSITLSRIDSSAVGIAEVRSIAVASTVSDSSALALSESAGIANAVSSSDSSGISVQESAVVSISIVDTDTSSISINETNTSDREIASTDSSAVAITSTINVDGRPVEENKIIYTEQVVREVGSIGSTNTRIRYFESLPETGTMVEKGGTETVIRYE